MERWRKALSWREKGTEEQKSDPVSLGTRRAVVTFLLIMAMAILLVAAISRVLH